MMIASWMRALFVSPAEEAAARAWRHGAYTRLAERYEDQARRWRKLGRVTDAQSAEQMAAAMHDRAGR